MTIRETLQRELKAQGMTQDALALAAGTFNPNVNRILRGKCNPMASTLERLADGLDCTWELVRKTSELNGSSESPADEGARKMPER